MTVPIDTVRAAYLSLQRHLTAVERRTGLYLADENIDDENAADADSELERWKAKLLSAKTAASDRAAEVGLDINTLLGRVICRPIDEEVRSISLPSFPTTLRG